MEFFSSSFLGGDTYDIELRAVSGGESEVTLGSYQRTMPAGNNQPVAKGEIDFPDFVSSEVTEFRLYIYNLGQDNGGFRLDDLILNGETIEGSPLGPEIVTVERTETIAEVQFRGVPGETYRLVKSLDLNFGNASVVSTLLAAEPLEILADDQAIEEKAFYRVERLSSPASED